MILDSIKMNNPWNKLEEYVLSVYGYSYKVWTSTYKRHQLPEYSVDNIKKIKRAVELTLGPSSINCILDLAEDQTQI